MGTLGVKAKMQAEKTREKADHITPLVPSPKQKGTGERRSFNVRKFQSLDNYMELLLINKGHLMFCSLT